ncbi:MAG: hypothetical protein JXR76_12095 [Deltaproteobacteria bacterium]|nr:hypothetical protein [Deltaproteobacteria bacterium]
MAATFIVGTVFFAVAVLALSIGVIFKKKTPLKGHCHTPVDGSAGCSACGDESGDNCDSEQIRRGDLVSGNFKIQKAPEQKVTLLQ